MRILITLLTLIVIKQSSAQFHPPVGQPGTSAIHKDSIVFVGWASGCQVTRGYQNCANIVSGYASAGIDSSALGMADGITVSLGDEGIATVIFSSAVYDGVSYDFAVFENSFSNTFLELAFVEVSSDGINFFRFPATSYTQDTLQTGSFGFTNAEEINNLAGKYRVFYGTPFDLQEMVGTPGLDVNHVTHIRIIDVSGNIEGACTSFDQYGNAVNDPWPTEFPSGGFDFDAVGVIHQQPGLVSDLTSPVIRIYPQPATDYITLTGNDLNNYSVGLFGADGKQLNIQTTTENTTVRIDLNQVSPGIYFLQLQSNQEQYGFKIIVE